VVANEAVKISWQNLTKSNHNRKRTEAVFHSGLKSFHTLAFPTKEKSGSSESKEPLEDFASWAYLTNNIFLVST
jgi:hypothetical protein